jgi:hypothetical protein
MLDYLDKKFITGFVFGRGATYTAINLVLRDSAIALLTEMHSHRLNTRSCTTLINRLGDYETMQGSLPTTDITELVAPDMFADAPVVDAPKLPTNLNMDDLFDDLEPATAPKAQEPAPDVSHDVAADILSDLLDEPAPALDVDQDINDILDDLQPSFNVHQDDSWNELLEPSQEELDAIEEEEYRNAPCEDDPEELAAFELLEAKVHNKNKQSPAHKATTIEEYRAMINGYADEDNDVPTDENTVSIEEVALEDDGDDDDDAFAAYGEWDEVSLPLTREYWGDAIGRADVILADMGFEVEDDYVTLPRKHVKSMVIRLRQLSIHGYQGADILDEFEDEIDDELDLWSAAQWQG